MKFTRCQFQTIAAIGLQTSRSLNLSFIEKFTMGFDTRIAADFGIARGISCRYHTSSCICQISDVWYLLFVEVIP